MPVAMRKVTAQGGGEMPREESPELQRRRIYSAAKALFAQEILSSSTVLRYVAEEAPRAPVEYLAAPIFEAATCCRSWK